jgi:hypothetical protein
MANHRIHFLVDQVPLVRAMKLDLRRDEWEKKSERMQSEQGKMKEEATCQYEFVELAE